MRRIEKKVFLSYRRVNYWTALAVFQDLQKNGYDVFFDYKSIPSGDFQQVITENIRHRAHFIVVLSPSALERCNEPGDWLRREIELAIDNQRNIIPLMMEGFDFGSPATQAALTGKLTVLKDYSAMSIPAEYFEEAMSKLRSERFLNRSIDAVVHPISKVVKQITIEQQSSASKAAPVEKEQLTVQEWFERGFVYQQDMNFSESLRCYTEVTQMETDKLGLSITYSNLGVLYSDFKRYEEAEAAFRKAIELDPSDAKTYSNLGILLKSQERYEEAEAAYRKAIDLDPSYASAYSNLGILLSNEHFKRYEEAEAAFRKAIHLDPSYATAYSNLGNLLFDEYFKRYEEAEAAYRKAIDLDPSYADAYYNLGILLKSQGRYEEAEAAYRKAIDLDPSYATAYSNLGNLLFDEYFKRYEEAEAAYRKAIDLDSSYANAYYNLGILLKFQGRYEEAEAAYRKGIDLNPSDAKAYSNLGQLLLEQGKYDNAIQILTAALIIDKGSANCLRMRGFAYQTKGELEMALDDYRQAVILQPEYGLARMSLFGLLVKMGRTGEAADHEESARKFAENSSEYNRACFEALCGNVEKAIDLLKIALDCGQSSKAWARQDSDFENLWDNPRFKKLVGE